MFSWLNRLVFDEEDMKNVNLLKQSKVKSRRVIGRGTLVADASEIRKTTSFQKSVKRAAKLID